MRAPAAGGDVYRMVAHRAVHRVGIGDMHAAAIEPERCALTFLGEREDFANDTVARFVDRLIPAVLRSGPYAGRGGSPRPGVESALPPPNGDRASASRNDLRTVLRCVAPGSREPIEIVARDVRRTSADTPCIAVFLNRRPLPREACAELCAGAALVIVAGWAYAVRFLPVGMPAIVTYGAYDAAVDGVAAAISGESQSSSGPR